MNNLISPEDLVSAMVEAAETYTNEVRENVEKGIDRIADEALKEIRELSPVYKGNHVRNVKKFGEKATSGAYRRRWNTYRIKFGRMYYTVYIYNRQYQLVHLLELGHLLKDGTGRVYGKVPAYPHVKIVQQHAEEKVDKLLEEI